MDWKTYSFVVRGRYKRLVVLALDVERTPTQIAKMTGINLPHVSRTLALLFGKKLVTCLTPDAVTGKVFALTPEGKKIRQQLIKSEPPIEN